MAGFGSSMVFLSLGMLFFVQDRTNISSYITHILVAILHISGNIGMIAFIRHGFDKGLLFRFVS